MESQDIDKAWYENEEFVTKLRETFDHFDENKDGTISKSELGNAMRLMGNNPTDADINALMEDMDTDQNGRIDFDEFKTLMESNLKDPLVEKEDLRAAFRTFDKNGDGYIVAAELKVALSNCGQKLDDIEIAALINQADLDQDGRLNYEEFVSVIMN